MRAFQQRPVSVQAPSDDQSSGQAGVLAGCALSTG